MENVFVFVTVGFTLFYHKTENAFVFSTVRFAVKKSNGKRCLYCYGTVHSKKTELKNGNEKRSISFFWKKNRKPYGTVNSGPLKRYAPK